VEKKQLAVDQTNQIWVPPIWKKQPKEKGSMIPSPRAWLYQKGVQILYTYPLFVLKINFNFNQKVWTLHIYLKGQEFKIIICLI
jgi:hypothetical protein